MKGKMMLGVAATVVLLAAGNVQAADVAVGKAKFATCVACHGVQGEGMAIFPKLAGKTAEETTALLKTYRAGETVGPNSALMMPQASALSDEDIANLAAYIATL